MKHDFEYISKNSKEVKDAYSELGNLINELQDGVREYFTFKFYPVGSYKRNMITRDLKSNIGFDFDINIEVNDENDDYSPKEIKNILIEALNRIVGKYGYDYPENSTRVITIKVKDRKHSKIIHSCDFAIVNNYIDDEDNDCQEYIRFNKKQNSYTWEDQPTGFYMLPEKIKWIKENNLWEEMKSLYIKNKNNNSDSHKHSRSIFADTVHKICQQNDFPFDEY